MINSLTNRRNIKIGGVYMNINSLNSVQETLRKYERYVMNTIQRYPVSLERGDGMYVFDTKGKMYLDFASGIGVTGLGHNNSIITDTIKKQASLLLHSSNLVYIPSQAQLAELLVRNSCFDKVFFCNSGAEANEAAIKIARLYAQKKFGFFKHEIITLKNSFHGRTLATITATAQPRLQEGFGPLVPGFQYGDPADIKSIQSLVSKNTCAILVELVQGEGGVLPLDPKFVLELRELCDKYQLLLIVDEVQTGNCRTGTFYAYEQYNVEPDIMTLAKGLANGIPIGAMLAKEKVAEAFVPGVHGTTFGGNPFATAVGAVTMNELIKGNFAIHSKKMGKYFFEKLKELEKLNPEMINVRGLGLMLGIQVKKISINKIVNDCWSEGLWVLTAGNNTIRLLPPLIIKSTHIDEGVNILKKVLDKNLH